MSNQNLIASGRHAAICRNVQFSTTKKGDEQIAIGFEIVGDDIDAGRPITYFGMFTDTTVDFTVDALRNCGWQGDDLAELPRLADEGLLANEVSLVVEHEEWEGEWKAKVKWVNRQGGGKIKLERALDDNSLSRFAAAMKSKVRAAGRDGGQRKSAGSNGRSSAPVDNRNVPPPSDEDVPFATCDICAEPSPVAAVLRRGV